jgi:hypothetical protein
MGTKLTRLTHKIAIQLHIWQRAVLFAVLAPGGQSGNFWIQRLTSVTCMDFILRPTLFKSLLKFLGLSRYALNWVENIMHVDFMNTVT